MTSKQSSRKVRHGSLTGTKIDYWASSGLMGPGGGEAGRLGEETLEASNRGGDQSLKSRLTFLHYNSIRGRSNRQAGLHCEMHEFGKPCDARSEKEKKLHGHPSLRMATNMGLNQKRAWH
jgi:hypothetical protein